MPEKQANRIVMSHDGDGREPLLTTRNGRPSTTSLRAHINVLTRPCHYTGDCPHNRQQGECEAAQYEYSQRCPSSVSPHPSRRSAITPWLNNGHRKELISDRMEYQPTPSTNTMTLVPNRKGGNFGASNSTCNSVH
ncbi:MAG: hypothetical protein J07HX5_01818 [halophilic archaeon J07HX5]|nr:MAG: hypothetical protein J07HX5_01818 [halophilic archaeon J07HX5]